MAPQLPRNVLEDLDTDEDELDDQNDDLDGGIRPEIDGDVSNDEDGYEQHCGDECPDHDIMNNIGDFSINNNANKKVETSRTKLNDTDLTPQPTRRLIKADLSLLNLNSFDQDDDDDMYPYPSPDDYKSFPLCGSSNVPAPGQDLGQKSPWQRAVCLDLTTQSVQFKPERRYSLAVCQSPPRPKLPEMQWKNCTECLSLTLEEVVHIRSVLTKAELESLLVDTRLYEDVARGKVCFLCRKTKFGFFGPWGQKCKLCKRNVCEKCCSKMRIPTEHFASIPVYMLSPSPMSSSDDESSSRSAWRMSDISGMLAKSTGSAPSSPMTPSKADHSNSVEPSIKMPPTSLPTIPCSPDECPASLAPDSGTPVLSSTPTDVKASIQESHKEPVWQSKPRLLRSQTLQRADHSGRQDKLYGTLMNVCKECKAMVCHIIVASRTSMMLKQKSERVAATFPLRLKMSKESSPPSRDLNLNLSPIY